MVWLGFRLGPRCWIIFDLMSDRESCSEAHAIALKKARSLTSLGTYINLMKERLLARTEHVLLLLDIVN